MTTWAASLRWPRHDVQDVDCADTLRPFGCFERSSGFWADAVIDGFFGLDDGDNTLCETTIWRFHEALARANAFDAPFCRVRCPSKGSGIPDDGRPDPRRQHYRRTAPAHDGQGAYRLKDGGILENWTAKLVTLAQKDRDARSTLKHWRRNRRV